LCIQKRCVCNTKILLFLNFIPNIVLYYFIINIYKFWTTIEVNMWLFLVLKYTLISRVSNDLLNWILFIFQDCIFFYVYFFFLRIFERNLNNFILWVVCIKIDKKNTWSSQFLSLIHINPFHFSISCSFILYILFFLNLFSDSFFFYNPVCFFPIKLFKVETFLYHAFLFLLHYYSFK
jgi:hypothetical protein